jgi:hypothetical protein
MRETRGQISSSVIESVEAALLRALGEVAGIRKPTLSPVDYGEVQLTVGCSDESNECLQTITRIAETNAIIVRHLSVEPDGTVALRILYFDEEGGPVQVQVAVLADHVQDLAQAVPDLVRRLFQIPEPPPQGAPPAVDPAAAVPPQDASSAGVTATATTTDRGLGKISTLTWVALGAGAAVLGTGIALGLTAKSDYDDFKSTPVHTQDEADAASEKYSSIKTRATIATVMIPVGAIALGAGAVLLGIDLTRDDSDASGASVQVIPLPSGGAFAVHGRFGGAL